MFRLRCLQSVEEKIQACGRIILDQMPTLIPGAEDLVAWTSAHFRSALVTRGVPELQRRKVAAVGLDQSFETIEVVSAKTAAAFTSLFSRLGVRASEA